VFRPNLAPLSPLRIHWEYCELFCQDYSDSLIITGHPVIGFGLDVAPVGFPASLTLAARHIFTVGQMKFYIHVFKPAARGNRIAPSAGIRADAAQNPYRIAKFLNLLRQVTTRG
jgi:hypothetical protein